MSIRILAHTAILAGVVLASTAAASADVFPKIDSVPGYANQRSFEGQILLTGASMNISSLVMPDPDGLVDSVRSTNVGPAFINKAPDRSSPRLMMSAVEGAPPRVWGSRRALKLAGSSKARKSVPSTSSPDAVNGNAPMKTVEISYSSMRYQYFSKDSKGQRSGTMEEVKWSVPESQLFLFDEGCR